MKFAHVTINVKDLEESVKFYQEVVGLSLVNRFPAGPNMEIVFLGEGETLVELIYDIANPDITIGKDISIGFAVDSLNDMMDFVKDKGIEIESGPFEPNPNTRFFFVLDPNGLRVQFIEQK
ncbi:MAG: VOC family protein [Tissierellaceae bacterium]